MTTARDVIRDYGEGRGLPCALERARAAHGMWGGDSDALLRGDVICVGRGA